MSKGRHDRKAMDELGSVSTNTPNELLAWATFMSNPPMTFQKKEEPDLITDEIQPDEAGPGTYDDLDFWEKSYGYNGKIKRNYHDNSKERIRETLLDKNIIREKGLPHKNGGSGPNPKKYSFNVKWLGEYLHTGHKINLNEKEAETLVALEKLYNTDLVRKLLSPEAQIIKNHETGETYSIKNLVFDTELSPGEIRSLYSFSVINLPFMILIGRYVDTGKNIDIDESLFPNYILKTIKRGVEVKNIHLSKNSISEKDYDWANENLNRVLDNDSVIEDFGSSFEKADKQLISDDSLEVFDEVMDVLMPSYISAKLHQDRTERNIKNKRKKLFPGESMRIMIGTKCLEASENIIMNKTEIGRQIAPAFFQES